MIISAKKLKIHAMPNQRFKQMINLLESKYQINQNKIAEKCGFTPQHLSNVQNGKKTIALKTLHLIKQQFPEISIDYILKGTGSITEVSEVAERQGDYLVKGKLKVYDLDVQAGYMPLFDDVSTSPSGEISFLGSETCDFAVKVHGESMSGKVSNGGIVAVKGITDLDVIPYGHIFLIITDDLRTLKYIRKSEQGNDFVKLIPHNQLDFDAFDIHRSKIKKLYIVKKILNDES
jgi:transcriptional regulator with XRE-family HTH domain